MSDPARWTTPADVVRTLGKLWERGRLLAARISVPEEGPLFPLAQRLARPDSRDLAEHFDAVRQWIRTLEEGSKLVRGTGYEIVWEEINHRQLGRNRLPVSLVIPSEQDALALLGKRREAERFSALATRTLARFPALAGWLARRPFVALEQRDDWELILAVLSWFVDHPRPGIYLRQLEIPGVDSKFIEARKALIAELLELVLDAQHVQSAFSATRQFELRYGLLPKPALVRFRILDPALSLGPLCDITTPAAQFAGLQLPVERVFITENEINGLAFPTMPRALVIFGLGYGLERLGEVAWLRETPVHYWGDIDTHGFAILDRLRAGLPHARSLLMDRETLMLHQRVWGREPAQHLGALTRLNADELALCEALRTASLGPSVRLEQERVAFSWVRQALAALGG